MATPQLRRQALADSAALIDFVNKHNTTNGCKWFAFGGSYSGALSTWFRVAYPNATVGALSSSGVVNAVLDFTEFDVQVSTAIGYALARHPHACPLVRLLPGRGVGCWLKNTLAPSFGAFFWRFLLTLSLPSVGPLPHDP